MYVFWTSLWYLFFFFCLLVLCFITFCKKFLHNNIFLLITFFILINVVIYTEVLHNNILNTNIYVNGEQVNILLKNSVNKIHPFLLYSSTAIFFVSFIGNMNLYVPKKFYLNKSTTLISVSTLKCSLIYIIVALYLGSWWALQEGSWGGWWNWDASEVFGLVILYWILIIFHVRKNLINNSFHNSLRLGLYFLLIYFLLLQVNFSLISHNFGFRTVKFLNPELLLFSFLILFVIRYALLSYKIKCVTHTFSLALPKFIHTWICNQFILMSIVYSIIFTLVSSLIQSLLNFKFLFVFLNFMKLLVLLFFSFFVNMFQPHLLLLLFFVKIGSSYLYMWFCLISSKLANKNYLFHYILLVSMLVNLIYKHSTINDIIFVTYENINNNTDFITFSTHDVELFLNFFSNTTTFENKSFELMYQYNYIYQIYYLNTFNSNFIVATVDALPSTLNFLCFLSVGILLNYWARRELFF